MNGEVGRGVDGKMDGWMYHSYIDGGVGGWQDG